jgi:hypothetical protein
VERRSRAPRSSPRRTSAETTQAIVALREQLSSEGHDCGAATIAFHLTSRIDRVPSVSTIWRVLRKPKRADARISEDHVSRVTFESSREGSYNSASKPA